MSIPAGRYCQRHGPYATIDTVCSVAGCGVEGPRNGSTVANGRIRAHEFVQLTALAEELEITIGALVTKAIRASIAGSKPTAYMRLRIHTELLALPGGDL